MTFNILSCDSWCRRAEYYTLHTQDTHLIIQWDLYVFVCAFSVLCLVENLLFIYFICLCLFEISLFHHLF